MGVRRSTPDAPAARTSPRRPSRRRRPRPERQRLRPVHVRRHHPEPARHGLQPSRRPTSSAPQRYALLFKPGTYSGQRQHRLLHLDLGPRAEPRRRAASTVTSPSTRAGSSGNATQNFWRSAENLSVTPSGGTNRWAVSQAAPFRRMHIHGDLNLAPNGYGWASGGYIADIQGRRRGRPVLAAAVVHPRQPDRQLGQRRVEHGVLRRPGRPGARASRTRRTPRWPPPRSRREKPYLYVDGAGNYRVFVPALRTNARGHHLGRRRDARHLAPAEPVLRRQARRHAPPPSTPRWPRACNLLFTPGIYHLNQTINVTRANTVVLGLGYATIIPDNGVDADDGRRRRRRQARRPALRRRHRPTRRCCCRSARAGRRPSHAANPTIDAGRVLPHRRRGRRQGDHQPGRQQQQHDHRPHLGLARRPRQRASAGPSTPPTPA